MPVLRAVRTTSWRESLQIPSEHLGKLSQIVFDSHKIDVEVQAQLCMPGFTLSWIHGSSPRAR
jgi:hypothetical protein